MAALGFRLNARAAIAVIESRFIMDSAERMARGETIDREAWEQQQRAELAAEDVVDLEEWGAVTERSTAPAEPEDAPEPDQTTDALGEGEAPMGEAAADDAGHSSAFDPMPDPAETPTPDGKRAWHLELAIYYVRHGLSIMPLNLNGKPLEKGCYEKLISNEDAARDHWAKHPYCLIGIPAGANNLVVVDSDCKGHDGVNEFDRYIDKHGGIPSTPVTLTGSGGRHTFFNAPDGIIFKNSVGAFLPANDVRACRGFVVGQGVVRPDGRRYEVARGTIPLAEAFARGLVANMPQHLIDDLPKHDDNYDDAGHDDVGHDDKQNSPAIDGERSSPNRSPTQREINHAKGVLRGIIKDYEAMGNGSHRNAALNNAALRLGHHIKSGHLTYQEIYNALYEASRRNGYLSKDGPTVVRNTIKSGLDAGMREDARPPKDRLRDGATNGARVNTDKIAEGLCKRAERERASSNNESDNTMREQSEPNATGADTSARHGVVLFQLAHSIRISLRRAKGDVWAFSGYRVLDDDSGFVEFATPMTPDDCADHLASALPHLFAQDAAESFKRGDYDGGRRDGEAQQDTRPQDEIDEDLLSGVNFYDGEVIPPAPKIVKRLVPKVGVGIVGGQSGAGKTFVVCDLAAAVSTGEGEFFGHPVRERVGVVILAAEDAGAIRQRLKVAIDYRGPGLLPPATWISGFDFNTQEGVDDIVSRLRAIDRRFRRDHGVRLGIAIVDTITAAFAIENENDNSQIASLMKVLKGVGEAVGVFVFGVHHFGKTTETGLRGASAFTDNSDIVIAVLADRDQINGRVENRRVSLSKSRDDVTGPIAPFDLRYVQVGVNEDGDEYGACYVEVGRTEDYVMKADARKKRKLSNNGEMFMKALHIAIGEHGDKQRPFGFDGLEVKAVNREHIRDEFYKSCPADGDDEKAKSASRRQSFKRGFEAAEAANLVAMRDNLGIQWVWLVQDGGGRAKGEA